MTPSFRPKPKPDQMGSPEPLDAPRQAPPQTDEPDADDGQGVTLDMLGYRGADQQCESCSHFDGQSACDIDPTTPVEPTGGCQAHTPAGGEQGEAPAPDAGGDNGQQ